MLITWNDQNLWCPVDGPIFRELTIYLWYFGFNCRDLPQVLLIYLTELEIIVSNSLNDANNSRVKSSHLCWNSPQLKYTHGDVHVLFNRLWSASARRTMCSYYFASFHLNGVRGIFSKSKLTGIGILDNSFPIQFFRMLQRFMLMSGLSGIFFLYCLVTSLSVDC